MMGLPIEESQLFDGMSILPLKIIGFWDAINTYLTKKRRTIGFNVLTAYAIIAGFPNVLFQLMSIFYIDLNLERFAYTLSNCVPCMQVYSKVLVFWYRIDEVSDIFTLLRQDFLTCIPSHKMPKAREIYKYWAKLSNIASIVAFTCITLCISSWVIIPGVDGVDDTGAVAKKILGGWYPFPFSREPWRQIVFCYEAILMTTYASLITFFECFMIQPLLCLCAHFTVICYHMSTLKVDDAVFSKSKTSSHYMNSELRAILLDYNKLLRYTAVMQDILNILITAILATGIVVIIIALLQFKSGNTDAFLMYRFCTFLSYEVTEVVLICTSSSALQKASTEISFALYSSDWYLADKEYARTAQMMMVRTSKPLTLTAIKMYPVSVEILVGLFQFTYTTAMVLSK